jgi:hypothetical protein
MALSVLAIGLIAVEGSLYARRYLQVVPVEQVLPKTSIPPGSRNDPDVYRIASFHRFAINYGWAAGMKLHLIGGYDPFNYRHYQQYMDILQTGNVMAVETRVWTDFINLRRRDLLDALNVKYLVLPNGPSPPGFTSVASFEKQPVFFFYRGMEKGDLFVFRNDDFRQRAFWADEVAWANTDPAAVDLVLRRNLRTTAIVQTPQISTEVIGPSSPEDSISNIAAYNDTASFRLHARASRYLVLSEVWHPGWQAQLDGKPLRIYKTNVALMGAFIPAGDHTLQLTFRPLLWTTSLVISAVALLAVLAAAVGQRSIASGSNTSASLPEEFSVFRHHQMKRHGSLAFHLMPREAHRVPQQVTGEIPQQFAAGLSAAIIGILGYWRSEPGVEALEAVQRGLHEVPNQQIIENLELHGGHQRMAWCFEGDPRTPSRVQIDHALGSSDHEPDKFQMTIEPALGG